MLKCYTLVCLSTTRSCASLPPYQPQQLGFLWVRRELMRRDEELGHLIHHQRADLLVPVDLADTQHLRRLRLQICEVRDVYLGNLFLSSMMDDVHLRERILVREDSRTRTARPCCSCHVTPLHEVLTPASPPPSSTSTVLVAQRRTTLPKRQAEPPRGTASSPINNINIPPKGFRTRPNPPENTSSVSQGWSPSTFFRLLP